MRVSRLTLTIALVFLCVTPAYAQDAVEPETPPSTAEPAESVAGADAESPEEAADPASADPDEDPQTDAEDAESEADQAKVANPPPTLKLPSVSDAAEVDGVDTPTLVPTAESAPVKTKAGHQNQTGLTMETKAGEKEDEFLGLDDVQWTFSPEYRVQTLAIENLEMSGQGVGDVHWTEQRFRLDSTVAKVGVGAIRFQADFLDGVLFGDNGEFGGDPSANVGLSIASNRPNVSRWEIGLMSDDSDPLDRDSYGPVLAAADPFEINYLYADVYLPVGVIRAGRQPKKYGAGVPSHDGGPYNRWGVSKNSDAADRILFGTKLDEAFYTLLYGYQHVADPSLENGLIWAVFYDWLAQDTTYVSDDDLAQFGTVFDFRRKRADWFGWGWRDVQISAGVVYLSNDKFETSIFGFPSTVAGKIGDLAVNLNYMHINGATREVSEGFALLSGTEPQSQEIRTHGFQAVLDYWLGPVMLTMEFDLATGDDDPRVTTPLTSFNFARDMNVGLLLFEHVLAFESARSAQVGIENLSGLDAESFPITEVATQGRFTNGLALFPQVYVDIVKTPDHNFFSRLGGLWVWSQASGGVVDPILTSLSVDGNEVADDAVNFHGGDPARYYGMEVDLQLGYKYKHYFHWTVEGAVLLPGPALYDANGDAVNSFLVENRFEFRY